MNNERNLLFPFIEEKTNTIQERIGYRFNNPRLLEQALTRKTFWVEHPGIPHNEVLEFYGDKALEFIVMKKLSESYGKIDDSGKYRSSCEEGELTEIKKQLVCGETLAKQIRGFGFHNMLIMGNGDISKKGNMEPSIQGDLFEAIIGAVAIDSKWDAIVLENVVETMLYSQQYFKNSIDNIDYRKFIEQWCQKNRFEFGEIVRDTGGFPTGGRVGNYVCQVSISLFSEGFWDVGETKKEAINKAFKNAFTYIEKKKMINPLADVVGKPSVNAAINQLQELYQKGHLSEPEYNFSELHDNNGNPIWKAECHIKEINFVSTEIAHSKVQAKKTVAFKMLKTILEGDRDEA